jgi:hypothetical protein
MTIEYALEHPAERVYALLTDKTFLAERIEAVGEDPPTIKISKKGGKVEIELQRAARRDLPKVAAKLIGSVQNFTMKESWEPDGDGWSGSYLIEFDGVPGHVAADFDLYPTDDVPRMTAVSIASPTNPG